MSIQINNNTINYTRGNGGYRAYTKFIQWSEAISQFQKSIRRKEYDDCMWATVNIYNILLEGNKANWTNFINRVLIIVGEDIKSDPILINRIYTLSEEYESIRQREYTPEELAILVLSIAETLINANTRSRSVSYIKHEMLSIITLNDYASKIAIDSYYKNKDFSINIKKKPRWKACISLSNEIFDKNNYSNSGGFSAKSRNIIIEKFKEILSQENVLLTFNSIKKWSIKGENTEKSKAVSNLFRMWIKRSTSHKEHFIFIIKAILLLDADEIEYKESYNIDSKKAYSIINKFINMKRDIASYALDCHTGKFKKGSKEGDKHFAEIGSVCFREELEVPKIFKDDYMAYKLGTKETDSETKENYVPNYIRVGKDKEKLEFIKDKKIIKKVRAQLPCGKNRSGTWIVETEDGDKLWLKEDYKSEQPIVQLEFDKIKKKFGLVSLDLKWDKKGYLYCPSLYDTYKITLNKGVTVVDIKDSRLSRIETFTDDMIKQMLFVFAIRSIFDISDTNLTNVMYYNGEIISYDEMNTRNKPIKNNLWEFLFVMVPKKSKTNQLDLWLKQNHQKYIKKLESLNFNGINFFKNLDTRREHLINLIKKEYE